MSTTLSGGCQCGRVRYRLSAMPADPHLCHCRMCQKAGGNYALPLATVPLAAFGLTRGTPEWFSSSSLVRRGFCAACGTPLFYQEHEADWISIVLGALDDPSAVPPEWQSDRHSAVPFFSGLDHLPLERPGAASNEGDRRAAIAATNHQHPDRDTDHGPERNPGP